MAGKRELGWYSRAVGRELGLEAAVLIERLHWTLTSGRASHEHDGRIWWESSRQRLADECCLTERRLRTIRDQLAEAGLLLTRSSDRIGGRTWWTLNLAQLAEMYPTDYARSSVGATEAEPSSLVGATEEVGVSSVGATSSSVGATSLRSKEKKREQSTAHTHPTTTKRDPASTGGQKRRAREDRVSDADQWDVLADLLSADAKVERSTAKQTPIQARMAAIRDEHRQRQLAATAS